MHRQHVRRIGDHDDGREILRRIEGQLRIDARADHQPADVGEEQGVAVGRALGDEVGADVAVGAGLVLHHHRLVPGLGELRSDLAREDVRSAAGRVGHDEPDVLRGIALRERGTAMAAKQGQEDLHQWISGSGMGAVPSRKSKSQPSSACFTCEREDRAVASLVFACWRRFQDALPLAYFVGRDLQVQLALCPRPVRSDRHCCTSASGPPTKDSGATCSTQQP